MQCSSPASLCFAAAKATTPEEEADLALLRDNIESTLFQLDVLQGYRYRPQDYVEMIGSGLFFPLTSTDGTEQSRLSSVLARMEQVPRVLDEARHNLKQADPVFLDTALDENAGNTAVIEQIGSMIHAGSPLRSRYDTASKAARACARQLCRVAQGRPGPQAAHGQLAHRTRSLREDLRLRTGPGHA